MLRAFTFFLLVPTSFVGSAAARQQGAAVPQPQVKGSSGLPLAPPRFSPNQQPSQNAGVMMNGYPWFRVRYRGGRVGYRWGGIICGRGQPIPAAFQICI